MTAVLLCVILARLKTARVHYDEARLPHFTYKLNKAWQANCVLFPHRAWGFVSGFPGEELKLVLRRWGKAYGE